jgi:hypothetical protein
MKLMFQAFTDLQHLEKNFSARHGRLTPGGFQRVILFKGLVSPLMSRHSTPSRNERAEEVRRGGQ